MIDSHHHLWRLAAGPYDYPKPGDVTLYRDFAETDLAPLCREADVVATVVVQATPAIWETELLLDGAAGSPLIAGVVGWCDLAAPDLGATLDRLMQRGPLRGVRPMLQRWDNVDWLLSAEAEAGLGAVAARGLVFDALVDVRHLDVLAQVAAQHPDLAVVIDHMAKPWRPVQDFAQWTAGMARLGDLPNCSVKLSGFPFDATGDTPWHDYEGLCRRLDAWFGRERLLWGSDWPVVTRHASYGDAARAIAGVFGGDDLARIGGGNAERIYGLASMGSH